MGQKRAKFLAKKRAKSQQQQHPQIPHPPSQSQSNYQAPQQPQEYRLPPQQIEIRQPSPPQQSQYHAQPPERPSVTFSEQKYENPSYTSDDHDIQSQVISNQDVSNHYRQPSPPTQMRSPSPIAPPFNPYDEARQKKEKQEAYRQSLMEQMAQKNVNSHAQSTHDQSSSHHRHDDKLRQEQYRMELMQQMAQKKVNSQQQQQQKHSHAAAQSNNYNKFDEVKEKKLKQEQYRMDLMQQQQIKQQQQQKNNHFGSSLSPYKNEQQNVKEQKRAKQEAYRQSLMQQMKQKERQQHAQSNHVRHEHKQTEDLEEERRQKYAMELEEQMHHKRMAKMAAKEQQLLEDRRNTMNGSFLDGFGNNPIPQKTAPSNAYKMELDSQMREKQLQRNSSPEQQHQKQIANQNVPGMGLSFHEPAKDLKTEKMNQYKRELDEQRRILQERKEAQKRKEEQEAMKLEAKIKNDRVELMKQANDEGDGGLFGSNVKK